jgi:N-acyl-D-amino-acid deacylase
MLDLVIRAGKVVDGTGRPPRTADVGIADGRITEVGRCPEGAKDEIDADGLLVTPGFVDIHTHFDGQATWDPYLAPSAWHGVTSVAMGNCGVGFAPAWPDRHDWLISLMEGVEDIPGAALAEGLTWAWQTFPEYLDALDGQPRVLDIGAHVPHAALRAYVMGERGANPDEMPTDAELQQMTELLSEAVAAGAIGLGSSRTQNHRTSQGYPVGTLRAAKREMVALASALKGTDGVIQMISDAYQSTDPEFVAAELDLIAAMAATSQRPLSFSLLQPASAPDRWREIQKWVMTCQATGLEIKTQVAPRPIGILLGLEASVNPFVRCPSYVEVSGYDLPRRVEALADPQRRERILAEHAEVISRLEGEGRPTQVMAGFDSMFRLDDPVDYDLRADKSVASMAAAGTSPAAAAYDMLLERGGTQLLYVPVANFVEGNLSAVSEMIRADCALFGLSDAGAHCGAICDASFTTSFMTVWGRDRSDRLPIEQVVRSITHDTARHIGWDDRGVLAPGMLADINVIDFDNLGCSPPEIVHDLPAGGRRLVQRSYGYRHTIKSGQRTFEDSAPTGVLPGKLLRGAQLGPD